jgi:hypothetical protein
LHDAFARSTQFKATKRTQMLEVPTVDPLMNVGWDKKSAGESAVQHYGRFKMVGAQGR